MRFEGISMTTNQQGQVLILPLKEGATETKVGTQHKINCTSYSFEFRSKRDGQNAGRIYR